MLPALSRIASAASYPTRPVTIIVPVPPGGALDILARLMGQWLSQHMGQTFVIENRPGGGHQYRRGRGRARARGRLHASSDSRIGDGERNALHEAQFQFHPRHRSDRNDQQPALVMEINLSIPAKTVPEFIAWAKANPGKVSMASGGTGSTSHIGGELFKMMTGIDMVHVPYHGGAPALTDLMGGQVQVYFSPLPESLAAIKGDKVRALAVTTATRSAALPNVPTIAEFYSGFRGKYLARDRRAKKHAARNHRRASTRKSTLLSPIPKSRSVSRTSAACRCRCRPPSLRNTSSTKLPSGPR